MGGQARGWADGRAGLPRTPARSRRICSCSVSIPHPAADCPPALPCPSASNMCHQSFVPDVIIALGGGSPMDAAKVMWLLYEVGAGRCMRMPKRHSGGARMSARAVFKFHLHLFKLPAPRLYCTVLWTCII